MRCFGFCREIVWTWFHLISSGFNWFHFISSGFISTTTGYDFIWFHNRTTCSWYLPAISPFPLVVLRCFPPGAAAPGTPAALPWRQRSGQRSGRNVEATTKSTIDFCWCSDPKKVPLQNPFVSGMTFEGVFDPTRSSFGGIIMYLWYSLDYCNIYIYIYIHIFHIYLYTPCICIFVNICIFWMYLNI